ncbi:MAG: S9 family peptidase [Bdellovibrionales bacterium]|nr:S9 family peptidase [Bdellovibrionales bacterium]
MRQLAIVILFIASVLFGYSSVSQQKGPLMFKPAAKKPHKLEIHGDVRIDDYFWMRERDTPPVMEFLKQENLRTREALAPVAALEEKLYKEMRSRIKEDDSSVPVYDQGYYYYWRYQAGQEYPLHCRKKGALTAPEEIILDENAAAKGYKYFDVGSVEVSANQQLLGYAVDSVGRRINDIYFKDLVSGKMLTDKIDDVTPNFIIAPDNKTVFYVRQDPETLRSYQLFRYEIGSGKPGELVYEEKDTTYNIGVELTKSQKYIFLQIEKRDSSEYRILEANNPRGQFEVFLPRELNHEYSMDDGGDRFYILTNWNARNFRLMEAPPTARSRTQWKEVVAHNPKVLLDGADVYQDFVVLSERENGLTQLKVLARHTGGHTRTLKFPDAAYEVNGIALPDYKSPVFRFNYQSLVVPPSVLEENFATEKRETLKTREVPNYDPNLYETRRIWASAPDGVLVPISLVMRKDTELNGKNPALLYGYGSYGYSMEPTFRSTAVSLMDRGFVFAVAHIRGGSEMGRDWYEQGRLSHKMNTFTDFIACAEKLIKDGYTSEKHLHIMGGSAGGLLMGAVINLRPDLFKSAIAAVPFVDVLTTMLDESIPLTTGEYREWGNPNIKEQYQDMRKYSPYDNIEKKAYPNLLVTTGYHDSQVQYWEPAKWVAKLRDLKTDDNLLLMYTELEAGHSGASGRFEALKTLAKEYAFILMLEGVKD